MKRLLIALVLAGCSPNISQEPEQPIGEGEQAETGAGDVSMELTLNDLEPGDEVTSPLRFSGSASGLWYFEGDFPVRIVDGQGNVIAESYASSRSNWMTEEQVPFEGEITFNVTEPTEATLIFQEDDPSGMNVPAEHPVAVVLVPLGELASEMPADFPGWVALPRDIAVTSASNYGDDGVYIMAISQMSLNEVAQNTIGSMKDDGWEEVSSEDVAPIIRQSRLERGDYAVNYMIVQSDTHVILQVGQSARTQGPPPIPVSIAPE